MLLLLFTLLGVGGPKVPLPVASVRLLFLPVLLCKSPAVAADNGLKEPSLLQKQYEAAAVAEVFDHGYKKHFGHYDPLLYAE